MIITPAVALTEAQVEILYIFRADNTIEYIYKLRLKCYGCAVIYNVNIILRIIYEHALEITVYFLYLSNLHCQFTFSK